MPALGQEAVEGFCGRQGLAAFRMAVLSANKDYQDNLLNAKDVIPSLPSSVSAWFTSITWKP